MTTAQEHITQPAAEKVADMLIESIQMPEASKFSFTVDMDRGAFVTIDYQPGSLRRYYVSPNGSVSVLG